MKHSSEKNRRVRIYADTVILSVSFFLLLLFAAAEIQVHAQGNGSYLTSLFRALLLVVICLLFYLGGLLHKSRMGNGAMLGSLMILFFLLYVYLILNFTLFDASLGRGVDSVYSENKREYYLQWFVNFHPFRSIYEVYIRGFVKGYVNVGYMLLNLLGNICAFMPFSFFLPLFFKTQRHWFVFLPTMLLVVSTVEALQFCFMVGSCDVDDLILNVGGALLLFAILKIPLIKRLSAKLAGKKSFYTNP